MPAPRDYDEEAKDIEGKKYSYDFDARIRRYAIREFEPWLDKTGEALELGCHKGDFTRLLIREFDYRTSVVEASLGMADFVEKEFGDEIEVYRSSIEKFEPEQSYQNIFLINVLEHTNDPIVVLRRVNDWLSSDGKFFLLVPNANAPSRQLAVKMGILPDCASVTEGEYTHGHRRTYTLDTLERDAKAAGLKIEKRGGIFFKTLANYQFDRLLDETNIISEDYMEGCYQLGQQYTELCASIYLICSKGT